MWTLWIKCVSVRTLTGLRSLFNRSTAESGRSGGGGCRSSAARGHSAPRLLTAAEHFSRSSSSTQGELCSIRSHSTEVRPLSVKVQKDASAQGRGTRSSGGREEGPTAVRSCLRTSKNTAAVQRPEPCSGREWRWKEELDSQTPQPHISYLFDDKAPRRHSRDLKSAEGVATRREYNRGIESESSRAAVEIKKNESLPKSDYEMRQDTHTRCRDLDPESGVESQRNARQWTTGPTTNVVCSMQAPGTAALVTRREVAMKVSSLEAQGKDAGSRSHPAEMMQYVVREDIVRLRPETCVWLWSLMSWLSRWRPISFMA